MKSVRFAAVLLACGFCLHSQIVATFNQSPDAAPEVRIRNAGPAGLAAFAVAMNPSGEAEDRTQFVVFFDGIVDNASRLQPDQERAVPVLSRSRQGKRIQDLFELPIITAGIHVDGTTTGDAVLLTRLMLRRCNMLLAVETALELLTDAGRRNVPRDQLIEQFRKIADSSWRWYIPPEQQVGRGLYRSILDKLKGLPEGSVGSPFPPSAFVASEAAALNRQRVALLGSEPSLTTAMLTRAR